MNKEVKHYPKWKYHRTEKPQLVNTQAEDEELGEEWAESPADFDKSATPVEPPAPPAEPPASVSGETPAKALEDHVKADLMDILKSAGVDEKEYKNKTKAELIEMVKGLNKEV